MNIRKHFIFHGDVQGVGFRYRALNAANSLGVSGWVMNRYDGTVEMEAEGREQDIDELILLIEKGTYIRIEDMEVCDIPLENSHGFECKY